MPTARALGLIVDWGGVLTTPVDDAFAAFVDREGIDPASFRAAMRRMHDEEGSLLHQVEVGRISRTEFEEGLAAMFRTATGTPVAADDLVDRMFLATGRNTAMRAVVAKARRRGWRTAVLSNSWGNHYDEEDLGQLVDAIVLSERIGIRKPDPAAYLAAADALNLPPSSCVFVDDLRRNARAADTVGMTGFQYRPSTESALEDLLRRQEQS